MTIFTCKNTFLKAPDISVQEYTRAPSHYSRLQMLEFMTVQFRLKASLALSMSLFCGYSDSAITSSKEASLTAALCTAQC